MDIEHVGSDRAGEAPDKMAFHCDRAGRGRLTVLRVDEIAARPDQRFRWLTGGNRSAVRRQRTLQATLEWSYQLLSEEERTFLRWLALFAGGWSLEAAEALGAETLGPADDVLELLSRLVAKSMVVVEEARNNELGVSRYRFLETIRQFAQGKLDESDEAEIARSRHCEYFLAWAERAAPNEVGPDQQIWLRRLDAKLDNHRAALEWSRGDGSDRELRLAAALAHFWVLRGHAAEGRSRLRGALERGDPAPSRARAVALDWLSYLDLFEGDQCRPRALLDHAAASPEASAGPRFWRAPCVTLRQHRATRDRRSVLYGSRRSRPRGRRPSRNGVQPRRAGLDRISSRRRAEWAAHGG